MSGATSDFDFFQKLFQIKKINFKKSQKIILPLTNLEILKWHKNKT